MLPMENVAYVMAILGFLSGIITGWNVRDRKAQDDEAYRLSSIEQQMQRDGWVK